MYKVEKYFSKNDFQLPLMEKYCYPHPAHTIHSIASQTENMLYMTVEDEKRIVSGSCSLQSLTSSSSSQEKRHSSLTSQQERRNSLPSTKGEIPFLNEKNRIESSVADEEQHTNKKIEEDEGYGTSKFLQSLSMQPLLNLQV